MVPEQMAGIKDLSNCFLEQFAFLPPCISLWCRNSSFCASHATRDRYEIILARVFRLFSPRPVLPAHLASERTRDPIPLQGVPAKTNVSSFW